MKMKINIADKIYIEMSFKIIAPRKKVIKALEEDGKIHAIKVYRDLCNCNLQEAKKYVDKLETMGYKNKYNIM